MIDANHAAKLTIESRIDPLDALITDAAKAGRSYTCPAVLSEGQCKELRDKGYRVAQKDNYYLIEW